MLQNKNGFGLIEAIASMALLSTVTLGTMYMSSFVSTQNHRNNYVAVAVAVRNLIAGNLKNPTIWAKTVNRNPPMKCTTVAPGCTVPNTADGYQSFVLFDTAGNKLTYDPTDPTTRWSASGSSCPENEPDPSANCPIQFNAKWSPSCPTAAACLNPVMNLKIELAIYTPPGSPQDTINTKNYSIYSSVGSYSNTTELACLALNGSYNSNTNTCAPKYAAQSCASIGRPYQVVVGVDANGLIQCAPVIGGDCGPGSYVTGVDANNQVTCAPMACNCKYSLGQCTATCGGGVQPVTVISPALNGGAACPAAPSCNTQACPINCTGQWSGCLPSCGPGTQTYHITQVAQYGGTNATCAASEGAIQACSLGVCPVNCQGNWGPCDQNTGKQTYQITVAQAGTGSACPYANGATMNCPVACTGPTWSACTQLCGGGTQTFSVTTPALNGGACPNTPGNTQACNTNACVPDVNCQGAFGGCAGGNRVYHITIAQSGNGSACPFAEGAVDSTTCPVACVGSWGTCNGTPPTASRTYSITQIAVNGGAACEAADNQVDNGDFCNVVPPPPWNVELSDNSGCDWGVRPTVGFVYTSSAAGYNFVTVTTPVGANGACSIYKTHTPYEYTNGAWTQSGPATHSSSSGICPNHC